MAWWKRFFKKKTEPVEEDDWEQLVYTRNGVNFEEEDQRKRYIVNCLEQIAEASREIDLLTGEYTLVTSYLTDMEEIEYVEGDGVCRVPITITCSKYNSNTVTISSKQQYLDVQFLFRRQSRGVNGKKLL